MGGGGRGEGEEGEEEECSNNYYNIMRVVQQFLLNTQTFSIFSKIPFL